MSKLPDCDKRCVSAGHWLATNLDTGETIHIVRFGTIERRRRRDKFVAQHEKLCRQAYILNHWHKGAITKPGRKLVEKARKKLDYSPKSYDGDLFVFLMSSYRQIFEPGRVPNCQCGHCKYMRW